MPLTATRKRLSTPDRASRRPRRISRRGSKTRRRLLKGGLNEVQEQACDELFRDILVQYHIYFTYIFIGETMLGNVEHEPIFNAIYGLDDWLNFHEEPDYDLGHHGICTVTTLAVELPDPQNVLPRGDGLRQLRRSFTAAFNTLVVSFNVLDEGGEELINEGDLQHTIRITHPDNNGQQELMDEVFSHVQLNWTDPSWWTNSTFVLKLVDHPELPLRSYRVTDSGVARNPGRGENLPFLFVDLECWENAEGAAAARKADEALQRGNANAPEAPDPDVRLRIAVLNALGVNDLGGDVENDPDEPDNSRVDSGFLSHESFEGRDPAAPAPAAPEPPPVRDEPMV